MLQGPPGILLSPRMTVDCCVPPAFPSCVADNTCSHVVFPKHSRWQGHFFIPKQCLHFQPTTSVSLAADAWTLCVFLLAHAWGKAVTLYDRGSVSSLSPRRTPTSLAHLLNTRAKVEWTLACFLLRFLLRFLVHFTRGQDGTHFCLLADLGNVKIWSTKVFLMIIRKILFLLT